MLCDPMDCSPPGPSFHGIFQARILEWFAISFSNYFLLLIIIFWLERKICLCESVCVCTYVYFHYVYTHISVYKFLKSIEEWFFLDGKNIGSFWFICIFLNF